MMKQRLQQQQQQPQNQFGQQNQVRMDMGYSQPSKPKSDDPFSELDEVMFQ
jgi:hypothetical protein